MKTEKSIITTDRWDIPYLSTIRKDDKKILLCLHGFAGNKESSVVDALMKGLYEKEIGVFVFDWPAHGESNAKDSDLTVENCLKDLKTVMGYLKGRTNVPISCFATSFGGYIASLYAHAFPDDFEYMILRSPALRMNDVFRKLLADDDYAAIMQEKTIIMGFERKMCIGKNFADSLVRNNAFDLIPPHPDKMLIIQGDKDEVVDAKDTAAYADKNHIKLAMFSGADHRYKNPGEKERIVLETVGFMG